MTSYVRRKKLVWWGSRVVLPLLALLACVTVAFADPPPLPGGVFYLTPTGGKTGFYPWPTYTLEAVIDSEGGETITLDGGAPYAGGSLYNSPAPGATFQNAAADRRMSFSGGTDGNFHYSEKVPNGGGGTTWKTQQYGTYSMTPP